MKKKIELNKKTIKRLNLKLESANDRKVAPAAVVPNAIYEERPTKGNCTTSNPSYTCI